MPAAVRAGPHCHSITFVATSGSSLSFQGNGLDHTKEGRPTLIAIRLAGLIKFGSTVAWLIWLFRSLGRNLTDTVVTRRNAPFVEQGPYRFVRNPMYVGILLSGMSLGLALGPWLLPVAATVMFVLLALRTQTEER